ncbi:RECOMBINATION PROTEIN RECR [Mycoplasmopsis pulmonis]|uniref:Recombination protein RecR n=1 Tax=Mycoplasmopsis pulmonis (strain UAB CTIP) TaxID=272635 RepID=RECR_MYCPU|nr:recombination mediator RecR [Mycoplasmopsis pulmonis]Q98RF8.1 RecName: Full=Recombination protein RecR [Mycoplasmopsis pulmonis UAB CTIP]CAC13224.1 RECOMBINATION PROTEIN RECR [Mycoplasmopsis pulmonis]
MKNQYIDNLILNLKKLPGVGTKQAEKISFFLLKQNENEVEQIINSIVDLKKNIKECQNCNFLQSNNICHFCMDKSRNKQLMIFETTSDALKFEKLGIYRGKYFIIKNLIENVKNANEPKWKDKLLHYASNFEEIIIALNPTIEGQITSNYIKVILEEVALKVTKLAQGLPINSQIDYIDPITLNLSFENRK